MGSIRIGVPTVSESSVRIPIATEGLPERFVRDDMELSYSRSVGNVPTAMLAIPAVGNLLPLAWASNSELSVATLDRRFADAVAGIRDGFNQLYPELASNRVLAVDSCSQTETVGSNRMLLFSGGVDSLASYIRHRSEDPILVSIHGADISVQNRGGWKQARRSLAAFARREATPLVTVESNCRAMLEYPLVNSHYRESITDGWWGGVQHGLALLTHCAPIAHAMGVSTVYIAATHTEAFSPAWGSCPELDTAVAWARTDVCHDGYELSRQDKIREIAGFVDATGERFTIRSCYESDTGDNCSRCEKCCRTIVGLEIAGLDPTNHGYRVEEDTFEYARVALDRGEWDIGRDEAYMWRNLQRHLPANDPPHDSAREFFEWFRRQDVADLRRTAEDASTPVERVEPYLKYVPEPGYRALKCGKRWLDGR
jgi:hypothetical protein